MSTFEDFAPEIRMRAYGASDPLIEMYVRAVILELCEKTRIWTRLVQEYAFKGDPRIIITSLDEDTEVLESVVPMPMDYRQITTRPASQVGYPMSPFAGMSFIDQPTGSPQFIFELPEEPNTVGVYPVPDRQYTDITFTISIKPSQTATEFPDFFAQHWRRAVVEGVLSKLHDTQGQTFSDPRRAEVAFKRYENERLNMQVSARRGRTVSGSLQVEMRPFARGHQ